VALALGTIVVGLTVHRGGGALPHAVRDVLGDALWAAMLTWWVAAAAPEAARARRAGVALALCFAVELGQLYRAPALDALRRTAVGRLVLGSDFDARDLAAYTAGVLAAALLEGAAARARRARPRVADA
jgi:hypothetical protein